MSSEYQILQKQLDDSIRKDEAKQRAICAKREEKKNVKRAGGGHNIARTMLGGKGDHDTDFEFGANVDNARTEPANSVELESQSVDKCMGSVKCERCRKFHGYCAEVQEIKENTNMLPTGETSASKSSNRKGGLAWIRIEDLTTTPQEAKILMVRLQEEGQWGPRVNLKLAFKGEIRYLGLKPSRKDPRYSMLLDAYGADENNWVDARILLYAEKDEFSESYNMRVSLPEKPKPATSRGR